MDKLNYCLDKIEELEKKSLQGQNYSISLPCREFVYDDGSYDLSFGKTITSEEFSSKTNGSLVIMISFDITASSDDSFVFNLDYDGFNLLNETKNLNAGTHSLFFMKAMSSLSDEPKTFSLSIMPGGVYPHTISKVSYIVWGDIDAGVKSFPVSASFMDGKYAIGICVGEKLLVAEYTGLPSSISIGDFSYVKDSVYASISYFKDNGTLKLGYTRKPSGSSTAYFGVVGNQTESAFENYNFLSRLVPLADGEDIMIVGLNTNSRLYFVTYTSGLNLPITYLTSALSISVKNFEIIENRHDRLILLIVSTNNHAYVLRSNKFYNFSKDNIKVKLTTQIIYSE